jgi:uncharacterized Ntn-hydrolase superfamily protein
LPQLLFLAGCSLSGLFYQEKVMAYPSTFSIAACDPQAQTWGVAVASKFPAVGAVVPWAQAGAGAIATQAFANTSFGPHGLELLASGISAEEALSRLLVEDPEREQRQVGIVDVNGGSATFTGNMCNKWAGGVAGSGYAIQGNILVSEQVVPAMQKAFLETEGELPERLYTALLAGDKVGGDRRGRQSAAIYVAKPQGGYGGFIDRWIDYRVDDHFDPVARLGDLLQLHRLYFGKSPESERLTLTGQVLRRMQEIMIDAGYYHGQALGQMDEDTQTALNAFVGNENFEERCSALAGWIDQPVFDFLIGKFGS